jgi:hypothetical protein
MTYPKPSSCPACWPAGPFTAPATTASQTSPAPHARGPKQDFPMPFTPNSPGRRTTSDQEETLPGRDQDAGQIPHGRPWERPPARTARERALSLFLALYKKMGTPATCPGRARPHGRPIIMQSAVSRGERQPDVRRATAEQAKPGPLTETEAGREPGGAGPQGQDALGFDCTGGNPLDRPAPDFPQNQFWDPRTPRTKGRRSRKGLDGIRIDEPGARRPIRGFTPSVGPQQSPPPLRTNGPKKGRHNALNARFWPVPAAITDPLSGPGNGNGPVSSSMPKNTPRRFAQDERSSMDPTDRSGPGRDPERQYPRIDKPADAGDFRPPKEAP